MFARLPIHQRCLVDLGIHLGELWYLTELNAWLKAHARSRFLLTAPPLRLAATAPSQRDSVTRLVGRIVGEPNLEVQDVLRSQRAELRAALLNALRRGLPSASVADLLWGVEFVWGALAFTLCNLRQIEAGTRGVCNAAQTEKLLAEMIRFFSAGFRALARDKAKA